MKRHIVFSLVVIIATLFNLDFSVTRAQQGTQFTIFRDNDSLTIYFPGNQPLNLQNLRFQVVAIGKKITIYRLDSYPELSYPNWSNVVTPICFRLELTGSGTPLPNNCKNSTIFKQSLTPADVFWYNTVANQPLPFAVWQGATQLGVCPTNPTCDLPLQPPLPPPLEPDCSLAGVLCDLSFYPASFIGAGQFDFTNAKSGFTTSLTQQCALSYQLGLEITYGFNPNEFGSWGISWTKSQAGHLDLANMSVLTFWVQSNADSTNFQIGIKDTSPHEDKVDLDQFAILNAGEWTQISIPLTNFSNVNLASIENVNFGFNDADGKATVCVDDLAFTTLYSVNSPTPINTRNCASTSCEIVATFDPSALIPGR